MSESLDEILALRRDLEALGRAEAGIVPPARLERAVMRAWDEAHATPAPVARVSGRTPRWAWGLATAAAALLVVALWSGRATRPDEGVVARAEPAAGAVPGVMLGRPVVVAPTEASPAPAAPAPGPVAGARSRPPSRAVSVARTTPTLIVIGQPIGDEERITVVRVRVAASSLEGLGVATSRSAADTVDVELLVAEDGVTRGVRIV